MNFCIKLSRIVSALLAVCVMFVPVSSKALDLGKVQKNDVSFYTYADISKPDTRINASNIAGVNTLVIPSSVSAEDVVLFCDNNALFYVSGTLSQTSFKSGQSIDLTDLCGDGEYLLEFANRKFVYKLRILFESDIPSMYLLSEDPLEKGREWVESSEDKSNKAKGSMIMLSENGEVVHSGKLTQIKGRGNTTWQLPKRPYQIKLEDEADLIRTGDASNKSKTWVLLANYLDPVGVRNTLALDIGSALGMPVNVQGESINLYYDGEYRGMYMLTEKVEVGSGRVEVADLEEENQKANPDKDIEEFPVAKGCTDNGATYTYCDGMISPDDITGGYLLEMDYEVRALEEVCYMRTRRGNYVVVKSPEYASKEEMDYIATLYQEYEDAVFGGGVNHKTKKKYSDYIDVKSLACYYLINEFSKARDCFSSSAYLNKKSGEDKFVMGPLWDYDMSFGKGSMDDYYIDDHPFELTVRNVEFGKALLNIPEFCDILRDVYKNEFAPLIKNVVLGDYDAVSENGNLHSLEYYKQLLAKSGQCNAVSWYENKNWIQETDTLNDYISQRYYVLGDYFELFLSDLELPDNKYYDVLSGAWYYDVVKRASENSILNGDGQGYFRPEHKVTCAHAAQAIYNLSGEKYEGFMLTYTDAWYSEAVSWAAINGYLQPYYDKSFRPDNDITREEFVDFLYKFTGSPAVDISVIQQFDDEGMIYEKNAMGWAVKEGIIQGADNRLNPHGTMTRAEMAAILVRYCELYKIL